MAETHDSIYRDVLVILHVVVVGQEGQPGTVLGGRGPEALFDAQVAVLDLAHGDEAYPGRPARCLHRAVRHDPNHLGSHLISLEVACSVTVSYIRIPDPRGSLGGGTETL